MNQYNDIYYSNTTGEVRKKNYCKYTSLICPFANEKSYCSITACKFRKNDFLKLGTDLNSNVGIYAEILDDRGTQFVGKYDCTGEAIIAVRDYMIDELLGEVEGTNAYIWSLDDGRQVELRITVKEPETEKSKVDVYNLHAGDKVRVKKSLKEGDYYKPLFVWSEMALRAGQIVTISHRYKFSGIVYKVEGSHCYWSPEMFESV